MSFSSEKLKWTKRPSTPEVARNLDELFAIMAESFQSFGILPAEVCEDRSIIDNNNETNPESCQEGKEKAVG